jgi:hypothetical protein
MIGKCTECKCLRFRANPNKIYLCHACEHDESFHEISEQNMQFIISYNPQKNVSLDNPFNPLDSPLNNNNNNNSLNIRNQLNTIFRPLNNKSLNNDSSNHIFNPNEAMSRYFKPNTRGKKRKMEEELNIVMTVYCLTHVGTYELPLTIPRNGGE